MCVIYKICIEKRRFSKVVKTSCYHSISIKIHKNWYLLIIVIKVSLLIAYTTPNTLSSGVNKKMDSKSAVK